MPRPDPGDRRDKELEELKAQWVAMMGEIAYLRAQIMAIRIILDKMTKLPSEHDTDKDRG